MAVAVEDVDGNLSHHPEIPCHYLVDLDRASLCHSQAAVPTNTIFSVVCPEYDLFVFVNYVQEKVGHPLLIRTLLLHWTLCVGVLPWSA